MLPVIEQIARWRPTAAIHYLIGWQCLELECENRTEARSALSSLQNEPLDSEQSLSRSYLRSINEVVSLMESEDERLLARSHDPDCAIGTRRKLTT